MELSKQHTFIDIIDACDNFSPLSSSETLMPWKIASSDAVIGLLRPAIVDQLRAYDLERSNANEEMLWEFSDTAVRFRAYLGSASQRSIAMREMCTRWRDTGIWSDIIGPRKWREELYPVYLDPFGPHVHLENGKRALKDGTLEEDEAEQACPNYAFSMERSACALFGVVTYGVHLSSYQVDENSQLRMWVPRRARTKQTYALNASMGSFSDS
jgi:hypothetical protein